MCRGVTISTLSLIVILLDSAALKQSSRASAAVSNARQLRNQAVGSTTRVEVQITGTHGYTAVPLTSSHLVENGLRTYATRDAGAPNAADESRVRNEIESSVAHCEADGFNVETTIVVATSRDKEWATALEDLGKVSVTQFEQTSLIGALAWFAATAAGVFLVMRLVSLVAFGSEYTINSTEYVIEYLSRSTFPIAMIALLSTFMGAYSTLWGALLATFGALADLVFGFAWSPYRWWPWEFESTDIVDRVAIWLYNLGNHFNSSIRIIETAVFLGYCFLVLLAVSKVLERGRSAALSRL